MPDVSQLLLGLLAILALVLANGFFVAAEFALVTVRKTRIDQLIAEGSATARVVRRALGDPDSYIAATQLGITMASLGLGWIGEPALAAVIEPAFARSRRPDRGRHRPFDRLRDRVRDHHRAAYRARRARAEDGRAAASRAHVARRRAPHRAVHARVLAVHQPAERDGPGGRARVRHARAERTLAGALGGRAEDARHRQPGGGRASRRTKSRCSTACSASPT